jgi:hypothetical protein
MLSALILGCATLQFDCGSRCGLPIGCGIRGISSRLFASNVAVLAACEVRRASAEVSPDYSPGSPAPYNYWRPQRRRGGSGRHSGLKIRSAARRVGVRVPPAPIVTEYGLTPSNRQWGRPQYADAAFRHPDVVTVNQILRLTHRLEHADYSRQQVRVLNYLWNTD